MLILSLRQGETIRIGKDITVMYCRMASDKVRLGITAPMDVLILREELLKRDAAAAEAITHDGGPDIVDGAPSDGEVLP